MNGRPAQPVQPASPPDPDPEREMAARCALTLDADLRRVFLWRFVRGLSFSAIAKNLGISKAAARLRVYSSLVEIKAMMSQKTGQAIADEKIFALAASFARQPPDLLKNAGETALPSFGRIVLLSYGAVLLSLLWAGLLAAFAAPSSAPLVALIPATLFAGAGLAMALRPSAANKAAALALGPAVLVCAGGMVFLAATLSGWGALSALAGFAPALAGAAALAVFIKKS
ncbi:MAG: hypothetical protein QMD09_05385 [Desulfatibacillaceae bacterium]|nr:hypothetical protein [Desulfatibacillaceae bacterium]